MTDPRYSTFLAQSLGLNYVGHMGVDRTDRSVLRASLAAERGKERVDDALFFGEMSWIEIGYDSIGEGVVAIRGRRDVVDLCQRDMIPALSALLAEVLAD